MAAEILAAEGISARVLSIPTVKPLNVEAIVAAAHETAGIVTAPDRSMLAATMRRRSTAVLPDTRRWSSSVVLSHFSALQSTISDGDRDADPTSRAGQNLDPGARTHSE